MARAWLLSLLCVGCGTRTGLPADGADTSDAAICHGAPGEAVVLTTDSRDSCCDIATDGRHVYFTTKSGGLARMPTAGGPVTPLFARPANRVLVRDGQVYFTAGDGGSTAVRRVPVAGGVAEVLASPGGDFTSMSVAPDGALWFSVRYAPEEGRGVWVWRGAGGARRVADVPGGAPVHRVAAGPNEVYVAHAQSDGLSDALSRLPVTGGALSPLSGAVYYPSSLVLDGPELYASMAQRVVRLSVTGNTVTPTNLASVLSTGEVAVDDTHVYFADGGAYHDDLPPPKPKDTPGSIGRVPKGGGDEEVLSIEGRGVRALAIDDCHVYFTSARGLVRLRK